LIDNHLPSSSWTVSCRWRQVAAALCDRGLTDIVAAAAAEVVDAGGNDDDDAGQ